MSSTSRDEELCTSNSVYRKTLGIVQTEFFQRKRRNIYKVSAVREREREREAKGRHQQQQIDTKEETKADGAACREFSFLLKLDF